MSMPEGKRMTLLELNGLVSELIETCMGQNSFWVEAEIAGLNERTGHCYLELIEKDATGNTPVARASAVCWRSKWSVVNAHFNRVAGKRLAVGMKVLLKVSPQFHVNYGFSWIVSDIDPSFTLGDMLLKRQRIIAQLKEEGMFDANRSLSLPMFTQRIAVISSETAAGYGDFCNHLEGNEFGYQFHTSLFAAVMQGEGVERSVIAALDQVNRRVEEFDCVVITRGGGATSDLSGFDTYDLACNVVNFPLPVITAIGHDRDESVLDMVSNVRVKTPTAAAALLIDRLHQVDLRIEQAGARILNVVEGRMQQEQMRFKHLSVRIPTLFALVKAKQTGRIDACQSRMETLVRMRVERGKAVVERWESRVANNVATLLANERHRLQLLEQRMEAVDPKRILERGYSITLKEGKAVRSIADLEPGDRMETRLKDGMAISVVTS
ncbi:MAG: exodeoxyribonuclease VII large subunit [Prevotella sp.]|nr:exodeoxyribonuclease VII large subunit [Prevotella sp.]